VVKSGKLQLMIGDYNKFVTLQMPNPPYNSQTFKFNYAVIFLGAAKHSSLRVYTFSFLEVLRED